MSEKKWFRSTNSSATVNTIRTCKNLAFLNSKSRSPTHSYVIPVPTVSGTTSSIPEQGRGSNDKADDPRPEHHSRELPDINIVP